MVHPAVAIFLATAFLQGLHKRDLENLCGDSLQRALHFHTSFDKHEPFSKSQESLKKKKISVWVDRLNDLLLFQVGGVYLHVVAAASLFRPPSFWASPVHDEAAVLPQDREGACLIHI